MLLSLITAQIRSISLWPQGAGMASFGGCPRGLAWRLKAMLACKTEGARFEILN